MEAPFTGQPPAVLLVATRGRTSFIDLDQQVLLRDLEETAVLSGREPFSFVLMPIHFHLTFRVLGCRTAQPKHSVRGRRCPQV